MPRTDRGRRGLLTGLGLFVVVLAALGSRPAAAAPAFTTVLDVRELGIHSSLRIRVFIDPGWVPLPGRAGHLVLVAADSAQGDNAFFIPTDLAFEVGDRQLYRVEWEQVSDLWGQPLGGRLREGETQFGFVMLPAALDLDRFLPADPESITVRYAHHFSPLRVATADERAAWESTVEKPRLLAGLNAWWAWIQSVAGAPGMNEGEVRLFAERLFPGQGELLRRENLDPDALRNAILRVGERKLLFTPAVQRVTPRYPAAARQAGAEGVVVVLAYVAADGAVSDALVLSSNTVHLLNVAALEAATRFRFLSEKGGGAGDGWRLLPFEFRLHEGGTAAAADSSAAYEPPRVLKAVQPEYPEKAYRSRIEGTVVYRVRIDARGKLVATTLLQSAHPLLDEAALAAVEQTLFGPAMRGNVPVDGELDLPFTFGPPKK